MRWGLRALAVLVAAGVGTSVGHADILQVTDLPAGKLTSVPSVSGDGRYVAFSSNANIAGLNPVPRTNVFVYEAITGTWSLITTDGGSDPSISADGRWVAFSSSADYTRANADGSDEIFKYDRSNRRFYQMTRDYLGEGSSGRPSINRDGTRIAYETNSNLSRRNPDFSNEVYFNRSGVNFAASVDPNGDGESLNPKVSGDGRFVVFETTSNLVANLDYSSELIIYDSATYRFGQLTYDAQGNGSSYDGAINVDGRFIAFVSSSNIANLNPEGSDAVFLIVNRRPTLVTETAAGAFGGSSPSVSDDGRWVVFVTSFNATGGNPDRNQEIVLYDSTRKAFTQLTSTATCSNTMPKVSGDGTHIVFLSNCDITGSNADRSREIFIADNPALRLLVQSEGPVNTEVRDPLDRIIRRNLNLIPGALYEEGDFDADGQLEAAVSIPKALDGAYRMTLFPELGALASDPVSLSVLLNGITIYLANDTVEALTGNEVSFNIQGLTRPVGRLKPESGLLSRVLLYGTFTQPPAATGPVTIRITDGANAAVFDLGRVEHYPVVGRRKSFSGSVNGFQVSMSIYTGWDGVARLNFVARGGDLTMFDGTGHVTMTVVVQVGKDTYLYQRRFKRFSTGELILQ
ncbi:MAG: PD40 domain-containing protein [Deltaproteobacteria bacterium]|nr:PD40 domain-containing protein [Deltaproteobacteria bacterium]